MKPALLLLLTVAAFLTNVASAQALINPPTFIITGLYFAGGTNYMIRVYGIPAGYCPANWAYVNAADDASQQKAAGLMVAYTTGKNVNMTVQIGTGGYCNVVEFFVNG